MVTMRDAFGLRTGFSDHTAGQIASLTATALGATIIEKHFTLDRNLPGPDHKASLEPQELKTLITAIRAVEQSLGDGIKMPQPSEIETAAVARKSLVALQPIEAGDILSVDNIGAKRPGVGISPMKYWEFLGSTSAISIERDDPL